MEKIINLTDVSDEAFAAVAKTINDWKADGAVSTIGYQTVEECRQLAERTNKVYNKAFNQGWLVAGLACVAGAGMCYLYDFVYDKIKSKK